MFRSIIRWIAVLMAAVMIPTAAIAQGGEEFRLHGYVEGTLRYESMYLEPHVGPGYKYDRASLSLPAGAKVKVLTQVTDRWGDRWVMVEATESGRAKRVYLLQQERGGKALIECDLRSVPAESPEINGPWQCMAYGEVPLRYGPGDGYATTGFIIDHDVNAWVVLMNNGWALVECTNEFDEGVQDVFYYTRGWIDFDKLIY